MGLFAMMTQADMQTSMKACAARGAAKIESSSLHARLASSFATPCSGGCPSYSERRGAASRGCKCKQRLRKRSPGPKRGNACPFSRGRGAATRSPRSSGCSAGCSSLRSASSSRGSGPFGACKRRRRLAALQRELQLQTPDMRLASIQSLSPGVRAALLVFMEEQSLGARAAAAQPLRRGGQALRLGKAAACQSRRRSRDEASSPAGSSSKRPRRLGEPSPKKHSQMKGKPLSQPAGQATVSRLRDAFIARMTVDCILIRSRSCKTREEAERLCSLLSRMREGLHKRSTSLSWRRWLEVMFASPTSSISDLEAHADTEKRSFAELVVSLASETWTFSVVASARAWTGKAFLSRSLDSVLDALRAKEELECARHAGWEAFRETLVKWLPERRLKGCNSRLHRRRPDQEIAEIMAARTAVLDGCRAAFLAKSAGASSRVPRLPPEAYASMPLTPSTAA
eukprot:TRINITY_DN47546_c0_g2_i1.p1 TRINITY_DN47546_c0_g2~~TRINITY_DN47546_c0_g2_i1.p1  ORF type:complete len:456 (+),score=86.04 TRINITY_DN47546_c0_g2_i1:269-1636(+)